MKITIYGRKIKKLFLFIFAGGFFLSSLVVNAQNEEGGGKLPLTYGAKIGSVVSTFSDDQPHTNSIQGVTFGGFVNYEFSTSMSVQAELLYACQGGRLLHFDMPGLTGKDFWYVNDVENRQLVLHNLNLPVLFKYTLAFESFDLFGVVGPDLGYTLHAKLNKEGTVFTEAGSFHTYTGSEDVTSNVNRFHLAATAGVGVGIPVGKYNILVDLRYRYGITSVYDSYSYVGIPQITGDLKNHTASLTVGLQF